MSEWQRAQKEVEAEVIAEAREYQDDYAERCSPREPYNHAEYARMEGGLGEGRWRGM